MWRIIFLAILVWAIIALIKNILKQKASSADEKTLKKTSTSQNTENATDVVQCKQCETHVLKSEALIFHGEFYCSKAHLPETPNP